MSETIEFITRLSDGCAASLQEQLEDVDAGRRHEIGCRIGVLLFPLPRSTNRKLVFASIAEQIGEPEMVPSIHVGYENAQREACLEMSTEASKVIRDILHQVVKDYTAEGETFR